MKYPFLIIRDATCASPISILSLTLKVEHSAFKFNIQKIKRLLRSWQ